MSGESALINITKPAAADLSSTGQYRFGKINSSGKIALAGDGGKATGIIQNDPAADEACSIAIYGKSFLKLGGTVDEGDDIASDAAGEGVVASSGDQILAEACEAGVDGDIITVIIRPKGTA